MENINNNKNNNDAEQNNLQKNEIINSSASSDGKKNEKMKRKKQIIRFNDEIYWEGYLNELIPICKMEKFETKNELNINLKMIAATKIFQQIIENTPYKYWNEEKMNNIAIILSPYIVSLEITKMHSVLINNEDIDANDELHGNLQCLNKLTNLNDLKIQFRNSIEIQQEQNTGTAEKFSLNSGTTNDINNIDSIYNINSLLKYSDHDIRNFSLGICNLYKLKILKISSSYLNSKKLNLIVEQIINNSILIEHIEFSYCQLNDKCCNILMNLLLKTKSIRFIELCGNDITPVGFKLIAYAIQKYEGKLDYLGIARNPIKAKGLEYLIRALIKISFSQIRHIDISGLVQITELNDILLITELIRRHNQNLESLNITGNPIGEKGGDILIECLKGNKNLINFEYMGCDLTPIQEYKIRILLDRNCYLKKNSYIIQKLKTSQIDNFKDTFENWSRTIRNPIMLQALEEFEFHQKCKEEQILSKKETTSETKSTYLDNESENFNSKTENTIKNCNQNEENIIKSLQIGAISKIEDFITECDINNYHDMIKESYELQPTCKEICNEILKNDVNTKK